VPGRHSRKKTTTTHPRNQEYTHGEGKHGEPPPHMITTVLLLLERRVSQREVILQYYVLDELRNPTRKKERTIVPTTCTRGGPSAPPPSSHVDTPTICYGLRLLSTCETINNQGTSCASYFILACINDVCISSWRRPRSVGRSLSMRDFHSIQYLPKEYCMNTASKVRVESSRGATPM